MHNMRGLFYCKNSKDWEKKNSLITILLLQSRHTTINGQNLTAYPGGVF